MTEPLNSTTIPSSSLQRTNKDDTPNKSRTPFISEEGAAALMELLMERNCFHDNPPLKLHHRYIWPHALLYEIEQFIIAQQGKANLSLVLQEVGVSRETLEQILVDKEETNNNVPIILLGHYPQQQLWAKQYLQTSLEQVCEQAQQHSTAPLAVSHVAKSMFQLPLDTSLELIRKHLSSSNTNTIELRTLDNGTPVLVGPAYRDELQRQVMEHFRTFITGPTTIRAVCAEQQWVLSWVLPILAQNATSLPGTLHGGDDTYIPHLYTQQQQQTAVELLQTVGVVTDAKHSIHQLMEWLSTYHPVALTHALVHPVLICHPLEVALQEADVVDLQPYVPSSLSLEDGRLLLQHVTPNGGIFVWSSAGGLFFSSSVITSFLQQSMLLLVQEYAHERAQQLNKEYGAQVILDSVLEQHQKDRKHTNKKKSNVLLTIDYGTVPVDRVVQRIRTLYCDAEFDDSNYDDTTWNEICTTAFLSSDEHTKQCQTAIHAALERMVQRTSTTAVVSDRNIPLEFERTECFAYACYMIQMSDHFLQYARDAGMDAISVLQKEWFEGPCADLTWRMTQYCLFRNNVIDDGNESFSFATRTDPFYKPVDIVLRNYPPIRFTCGKAKDPLSVLRQLLPGTDGVSLSRLWVLCGGNRNTGLGDMDAFRVHVQENCLPLIGLPYKILDKKSEKKFLSARRDVLLQRIQYEQDPALVLDWTIMVLYQQVKHLVVSGSLLRGPILRLLLKERKITEEVAGDLMALAAEVEKGEVVESDLLERIRNCTLKKK